MDPTYIEANLYQPWPGVFPDSLGLLLLLASPNTSQSVQAGKGLAFFCQGQSINRHTGE